MSEAEIKILEDKIKKLEKSNENWRRKYQRLRNKKTIPAKIYQIHEYGGQWEDAYDYIVSSYFSENKAITEKERLEKEEEDRRKCNSCPLYFCEDNCDNNCKKCGKRRVEKARIYCSRYEPFDASKHSSEEYCSSDKCINYDYGEESFFRIEEVEISE